MRIIVVSDSHGDMQVVKTIEELECDLVLHLGDGFSQAVALKKKLGAKVHYVKGNCDGLADAKDEILLDLPDGKKIFLTHGHNYYVKTSLTNILAKAKTVGAGIACFGHTHIPLCNFTDGVWLINPGSYRYGETYAVIDISQNSIYPQILPVVSG